MQYVSERPTLWAVMSYCLLFVSLVGCTSSNKVDGFMGWSSSGATADAVTSPAVSTASSTNNVPETTVVRDAAGGFSAGTVTAALVGNVTGNLTGNVTGNVTGNLSGNVTGNVTGDVSGTAANVTGVVAISNGGTGATTAAGAFAALLPAQGGNAGKVLQTNGTVAAWVAPVTDASVARGRLTLTSLTPVPTSDVIGAGTLHYTPYQGNVVALYDGSGNWNLRAFTERSVPLAGLDPSSNYDVFLYDDAGTVTMEIGAAWADATTRLPAEALALQDGILVKATSTTRRYVGTIRTTGAGVSEDSELHRFVWNMYNRVSRHLSVVETTTSWTYASATWRMARGQTANAVHYVAGLSEDSVTANVAVNADGGGGNGTVGIGIDNTSNVAQASTVLQAVGGATAFYVGLPAAGYHSINWLEAIFTGTITFYSSSSQGATVGQNGQGGLTAMIRN